MSAKSWIILAILFVIAIFTYDFAIKKPSRILPRQEKENVSAWKEFRAPDGSFEAKFPSMPQHATASDAATFGSSKEKVVYDVYAAQAKDSTTFLVKMIQYPDSLPLNDHDSLFDDVLKDMLANTTNSKLVKTTKDTFLGVPSAHFEIEAPGFVIDSTAFFSGKKLYVLTVMGHSIDQVQDDFDVFASSFKHGANEGNGQG